jgi:asparagine synthase (glutamine-hydrolysing)
VFASEIKALLRHPAIERDLDEEAFVHYLTFACTPVPMTLFAGVRKLAPAERMIVRRDGSTSSEIYWSPFSARAAAEVAALDERGLEERLLELLRASIAKRMMSDVPFGVFLSGGIDSSTNVALMAELMNDPVQTFSVGFAGEDRYNELHHARRVAKRFGADHHEVVIEVQDLESFLPDLIHHQDEPIADWVCVPLYFVSRLARESGTIVVQIGEGSDEIFHGYDWYVRLVRFARFEPVLRHMPQPLRLGASRVALSLMRRLAQGHGYANYENVLSSVVHGRRSFWGGAIVWSGDLKDRLLMANGHPDSYALVDSLWRDVDAVTPGPDLLQGMTYIELKRRLSELLLMRVDKMTMATSVEARVPFLDHELVEFAIALPKRAKVDGSVGKALLKKAVRPVVGADVVDRPKQGFGAPVSEWFRESFGERAQELIKRSSLAERELLDYDVIDELWAAHRGGANWGMHLWNILNVSAWHDQWIAGRQPAGV